MKGVNSAHRRNPLPFDFLPAPPPGAGRLFRGAVCSPFPANPCSSVPGSKFFTQFPRRRPEPAGFFPGAVCSPLPARPCSSVWGSKFFTHFPRRRRVPAAFFRARFAPPSPLGLVLPSGGAKSSHISRATARSRPAFPRRGLLPAPCEPLRLHFGEQNLHTISAPPLGAGRLFRSAVCSPLPANPCGSVPGSKIFTQFPRRHSRPAGFSEARFAPPSLRTLAAPFRGAKSSHNSRASPRGRPAFSRRGLLPPPR